MGGLDTTPLMSAFHMCALCKVVMVMGVDSGTSDIPLKVVEKPERLLMMELKKITHQSTAFYVSNILKLQAKQNFQLC